MKGNILYLLLFSMLLTGCSFVQIEEVLIPDDLSGKAAIFILYNSPPTLMTIGMIGDILLHHPLYTYEDYAY